MVFICDIDREVKVIKFRGDPSRMSGIVEVRGIVNKDGTISYGEFTQYDNEFGKPHSHTNLTHQTYRLDHP